MYSMAGLRIMFFNPSFMYSNKHSPKWFYSDSFVASKYRFANFAL